MPDITIAGATFRNVPQIDIPKDGGGTASFVYEDGSKSITENGTHDVSGFSEAIVNVSGGATNIVHGEFTAKSTYGKQSVTIPYTGNGYPIVVLIFVKGGIANPNYTDWLNLIANKAYACYFACKRECLTTPDYTGNGSINLANVSVCYKNSTTSSLSFGGEVAVSSDVYNSVNPSSSVNGVVRIQNATTMLFYVRNSSGGFAQGIDYEYYIIYSS